MYIEVYAKFGTTKKSDLEIGLGADIECDSDLSDELIAQLESGELSIDWGDSIAENFYIIEWESSNIIDACHIKGLSIEEAIKDVWGEFQVQYTVYVDGIKNRIVNGNIENYSGMIDEIVGYIALNL